MPASSYSALISPSFGADGCIRILHVSIGASQAIPVSRRARYASLCGYRVSRPVFLSRVRSPRGLCRGWRRFCRDCRSAQADSCRFLADTGNTLDVVDRIAGQGKEIRDLFGPDAEEAANLVITKLALSREIPEDIFLGQQLRQVLVARNDR